VDVDQFNNGHGNDGYYHGNESHNALQHSHEHDSHYESSLEFQVRLFYASNTDDTEMARSPTDQIMILKIKSLPRSLCF